MSAVASTRLATKPLALGRLPSASGVSAIAGVGSAVTQFRGRRRRPLRRRRSWRGAPPFAGYYALMSRPKASRPGSRVSKRLIFGSARPSSFYRLNSLSPLAKAAVRRRSIRVHR